jgi:hypothetical protein
VLALHGSADPVTPKPQMDALEAENDREQGRLAGVMFGHAAFVLRRGRGQPGPALRREAQASYRMMRDFFAGPL